MRSAATRLLLATLLACGANRLAAQNTVPAPADSAAAARTRDTAAVRPIAPPSADGASAASSARRVAPPTTDSAQAAAAATAAVEHGIRPIAVAKWTAAAGAVAAAVYGYHENRQADTRFDQLDRVCQEQPDRCQGRTASGAYQDADLEARFQEVKRLDHRAALGLVGAEVGVAAAVTLFLFDLHHAAGNPPNIPYHPPRIELLPQPDGVGLRIRTGRQL